MRLLALDGGGTKTVCLLTDERGRLLGWGSGGPSNLTFVSRIEAEASILAAVGAALVMGAADETDCPVDIAVCGGPVVPELMASAVERAASPARYYYYPEAPCCLASGNGAEYGAVVLAGTGCFEYAQSADGRTHRTDGFGSLVGDEGSAYYIAQQALIAVARAADGRGPATALSEAVFRYFGVETVRQITRRIHGESMPRHEIARLAPQVTALAAADDEARRVVRSAAGLLALGVVACIRAVELDKSDFDLVLCGGVFRGGGVIAEPLICAVQAEVPGARPLRPRYEPVFGALRLAFSHARLSWNEATERLFDASLTGCDAEPLIRTE
jgi:N-acetylglucosamine kinase-like BadF-type ATPase